MGELVGSLCCYNLSLEFFLGGLYNHTSLTSISIATMTILIYFQISKLYIKPFAMVLIEDRSQSTQSLDTSFE